MPACAKARPVCTARCGALKANGPIESPGPDKQGRAALRLWEPCMDRPSDTAEDPSPRPGAVDATAAKEAFGRPFFWPRTWPWSAWGLTLVLIGLLTLGRLIVLHHAFINLGGDEAQYWVWSRHLSFGYFTKPPLIAWLIRASTTVCGNGEACVRVSSPLLHGLTALFVFWLARALYDARTAVWSAITYATLPIVWFSTGLITTDVPLIACWAGALLAFHHMVRAQTDARTGDTIRLAVLAGLAIGLGMLAKYAMIYFVLGTIVYVIGSREGRRAVLSPAGGLMWLVAVLVFSPNIIWNIQQHFATVHHTEANADWGGSLFHPAMLANFLVGQVGVFGPVLFIGFLFGLLTLKKRMKGHESADFFLLCYSLPTLALIAAEAFISRANANWAATAYVALTIVTVAWFLRQRGAFLLRASLIISLVAGGVLYSEITMPGAIELMKMTNSFKRVRGWNTLGDEVVKLSREGHYKAIMSDDRMLTAELSYYARAAHLPVVVFDIDGKPENQFELKSPYTAAIGEPVLFVSVDSGAAVLQRFADVDLIKTFRVEEGGRHHLDFRLVRLSGFKD
jgi:hypothetical protein